MVQYNEDYFSEIDTKEKAYWLGFIYADGYVTDSGKRFGMELAIIDKPHMKKLVKALDSDITIRERERIVFEGSHTHSCSILFKNEKLFNDLMKHGVSPTKTKDVIFPNLKEEFVIDFIRGVFDGDGSIGIYKNGSYKKMNVCFISGNEEFLISIKEIMNNFGVGFNDVKCKFGKYELQTGSKENVKKFIELIYLDTKINTSLDRKRNKAMEIYDYINGVKKVVV